MQYYTYMKRCPDLSIKLPRNSAYLKKNRNSVYTEYNAFPMCVPMYLSIYYL